MPKVTTKLTALEKPAQSYEAIFLVDTGATDSMAPTDQLKKIGVRKEGMMACDLAAGDAMEYAYGRVRIDFMGETTAERVIFGSKECEPFVLANT